MTFLTILAWLGLIVPALIACIMFISYLIREFNCGNRQPLEKTIVMLLTIWALWSCFYFAIELTEKKPAPTNAEN